MGYNIIQVLIGRLDEIHQQEDVTMIKLIKFVVAAFNNQAHNHYFG